MLLTHFSGPHRRHRATRLSALALMAGAGLLMAAPARAEPSPALDRISLSLGAFRADPTLRATVTTPYGALDSGDVERNSVTLPRLKAELLLFDSQGLSFDYFRYRRGYHGAFASNRTVGSGTVSTTGAAGLDLKLDFAKLAYKWWLGSGATVLGLGVGAAYYRAEVDVNATATLNNMSGSISERYSDSAVAPLLEAGLRHALSPSLRLFADISGVRKNGGPLHGDIYNAVIGFEWFPIQNVGVVLDYSVSSIDLMRDGRSDARLRAKLKGPSAFLKVRF